MSLGVCRGRRSQGNFALLRALGAEKVVPSRRLGTEGAEVEANDLGVVQELTPCARVGVDALV